MALEDYLVPSGQPCWNCKKACGGCVWSAKLQPIPGWDAKPIRRRTGNSKGEVVFMDTYSIKSCPQFEREEPRQMPVKGRAY